MRFAFFTTIKYLFGRSRLGATGWISLLSSIAIFVVTAALVCVLSVYNGYVSLLLGGENRNLPELVIKPHSGDVLEVKKVEAKLSNAPYVKTFSSILISQGLLQDAQVQLFAQVYGVDSLYPKVVDVDRELLEGRFVTLPHSEKLEQLITPVTIGIALAAEGANFGSRGEESDALSLVFPKREGLINPLAPASAFVGTEVEVVGVLPAYSELVNRSIYMPIDTLRTLLGYSEGLASVLAIELAKDVDVEKAKEDIQTVLGAEYIVQNREEQQPELTILIKTERIMVYVIMLAILTLAAFNLASSLVMLIFEKEIDIKTLYMLGASSYQTAGIFAFTGILISSIGAVLGMLFGLGLCFLQESWEFLYSGEGINRLAFPIDVKLEDMAYIVLFSVLISALSASLPASMLWRNKTKN